MKCVHGVDLNYYCGQCVEDDRHAAHALGASPMDGEEDVPLSDLAESVNDRLATELAYLTQAIQGLSGNVAKLVDDRGDDEGHSYRPVGSKEHQADQHELNRSRSALVESLTVKRGPVTDDEITSAMGKTEHWMARGDAAREMLEHFAKSRGLID